MKTVVIENPSGELKNLLDASRRGGRVLVKRNGKPLALVVDVRGKDEEQVQLENDPEFWNMIRERRREPGIPWEQVKAELGITSKPPGKRAARRVRSAR